MNDILNPRLVVVVGDLIVRNQPEKNVNQRAVGDLTEIIDQGDDGLFGVFQGQGLKFTEQSDGLGEILERGRGLRGIQFGGVNLHEEFFFLHFRSLGEGIGHRREEIDRLERRGEQGVTSSTRQPVLLQPNIDERRRRRAIEIDGKVTEVFGDVVADRRDVTEKVENEIELNVSVREKQTNERVIVIHGTDQRNGVGQMFEQIGEVFFVHLRRREDRGERFLQGTLRLKNFEGVRI